MGLYINGNKQNIYRNGEKLDGNNQDVFIYNHTSELVKEQARLNDAIQSNLRGIKALYEHQHIESERNWVNVEGKLKELERFSKKQVAMEEELMQQLGKLESEQKATRDLLEAGQLKERELQERWSGLSSSHSEILRKLEEISKENEQLSDKVHKQLEMQESMAQQLKSQQEVTEKFEKRLDGQEALTAKITRQLDYFRSILFERTNFLADKIEEATSYVHCFLKKDDPDSEDFSLREKQESK